MNFFHVRYECDDSRDAFSSKQELESSSGMGFGDDEEEEDINSEDYADIVHSSLAGDDGAAHGPHTGMPAW